MTEIELIIDLHKNTERQGPGSNNDTLKAFEILNLPIVKKIKIADIGCGSGGQTLTLAKKINGQIIAIDFFSDFLDELNNKSQKLAFKNKIITIKKSMDDLPFDKEEFDIIWSEGAIYNIGFENGLKTWKDYLKTGGYIAISEITWITQSRPKEIEKFWLKEYPEIDTASNKIKIIENNGYSLVGYFYLKQNSWINYYEQLEAKFETFLKRHDNSQLAKKVVDDYKAEINLYKTYKNYYSYGFYIAKKN